MSFLYPRTISITRPAGESGVGALTAYGGLLITSETAILSGLPANIQVDRTGRPPVARIPGDPIGDPTFRIFVPAGQIAIGQVLTRDIVTDDTGLRHQVIAVEWQMLGVQLCVQLLET